MAGPDASDVHMAKESSIDKIEQRSIDRVHDRMTDDAPCRGDGAVICPFCDREMRVRRTILGRLDPANDDGDRPHVDGVQMKCAGSKGCGFRPDFDVPIPKDEWHDERAARDGDRIVDMGFSADDGSSVEERLTDLGYIIDDTES